MESHECRPAPPPAVWFRNNKSRQKCKLAKGALSIHSQLENGKPFDDITANKVMDKFDGPRGFDCTGLVGHLENNKNVYPEVLAGGKEMVIPGENIGNRSFDEHAPLVDEWPFKFERTSHQMDVKTAFLNVDIEEEHEVQTPPPFTLPKDQAQYVCEQSPPAWYEKLEIELKKLAWLEKLEFKLRKLRFGKRKYNQSVFIHDRDHLIIPVHVDDIRLVSGSLETIESFKEHNSDTAFDVPNEKRNADSFDGIDSSLPLCTSSQPTHTTR